MTHKKKDLRNIIEITRDDNFGIDSNKSEEPQPGPSGYKRPNLESSTSPPKKNKKKNQMTVKMSVININFVYITFNKSYTK